MKQPLMKLTAIMALATGMVFAQAPAPNPQGGPHAFMRRHMARLAQELNLTDAQKQQAKTIFQNARTTAQPLRDQLKQNHQALSAAAKAGQSDASIQQLATQQGNILGQLVAIRTQAFAKFYAVLTPEQRAKADQMQQDFQQRLQSHRRSNG
ncbi:MAG: hypothetical protein C5B51_12295 [Terriglobia bacterium]|nr:MAG: hypothetical protein C5B51_12295 [Terriglobia bacterium]